MERDFSIETSSSLPHTLAQPSSESVKNLRRLDCVSYNLRLVEIGRELQRKLKIEDDVDTLRKKKSLGLWERIKAINFWDKNAKERKKRTRVAAEAPNLECSSENIYIWDLKW